MNIYFFIFRRFITLIGIEYHYTSIVITLSRLFRIWKKYLNDTKKYFFTIETQRLKIHVQNIKKKKEKTAAVPRSTISLNTS